MKRFASILLAAAAFALATPAAAQVTCTDHFFDVALSEGGPVDQQIFGRHCVPASSPSPEVAGTLLVLVHGITYDHDYWNFPDPTGGSDRYSFEAAMHAAGFPTLALDRIGIGQSSHPLSTDVTIDTNAHAVHGVLQAVRGGAIVNGASATYDRIVQIGHSYGSWTTWYVATRYDDVDAVVLTGATHGLTTVDAPFGVASRLYPASSDPRWGPTSLLDPGYLTTRPGERYGAFYSPAMIDPAVIEHDEATKETVTNSEIQNYQLILAEPLDIRVPVLLTIGQSDELFCGPAPGGADCSSDQALVAWESPFLGPNVPSVDAYVLVGGSHDMNQQLHAHLYFDAVLGWLNGTVLASVGCAGDADCDTVSDAADLCPGTPGGRAVDADGCNAQHCLETVATGTGACSESVLARNQACVAGAGADCTLEDDAVFEALIALGESVTPACGSAATVQAAGFGAAMNTGALVSRAQEACRGGAASLAARSYGGPHAKLRGEAPANGQACLDAAYDHGESLAASVYGLYAGCALDAACDPSGLGAQEADLATLTAANIDAACAVAGTTLANELGSPSDLFVERGVTQAHCQAAAALGDTSSLPLRCGPNDVRMASGMTITDNGGNVVATPLADLPRDTFFRVVLDSDVWGTRCGDGSEYAFGIEFAPAGAPLGDVLTQMAGGGVCITPADCIGRPPGLFHANFGQGVFSGYQADRPENPFRDLTMVHQPYCTQDVHAGGGGVETGTPPDGGPLYRYGAINFRRSMDAVRNLLWAQMDAHDTEGYRPDRVRAIISGSSAGGYGVLFNYAYPLDELNWIHTLGHDHVSIVIGGGVPGVEEISIAKEQSWNTVPYLPPYCNDPERCIVSDEIVPAHAERLGASHLQQFLSSSPQHDNTQEGTQGFNQPPLTERSDWINGVRQHYCGQQGEPHRFYFLPANPDAVHGFVANNSVFDPVATAQLRPDGTDILSWLHGIYTDPDGAVDRVEEGQMTTAVAGVQPFPCDVGDSAGGEPDYDPTPDPTSTVGCRVDGTPSEPGERSCSYVADGAGVFESTTLSRWSISVVRDGQTVELAGGPSIVNPNQSGRAGTILSRDGELVTVRILFSLAGGTHGFVAAGGPSAAVFGGGAP